MDVVKLAEYLKENSLTCAAFARSLNDHKQADDGNVSPSMVDRWKKGETPRPRNRKRIFDATTGQVAVADWFGDELQPKKRKARDAKVSRAASRKGAATMRRRRQTQEAMA